MAQTPSQDPIIEVVAEVVPLKPATPTRLGGVKIGTGLNVTNDGTTSTTGVQALQQGANITIDNTDPKNPIITSTASAQDTILLSGGQLQLTVDDGTTLSVFLPETKFRISGVDYTQAENTFNLNPRPASGIERIDVGYLDATGFHILTGAESATPVKPTIPTGSIELSDILVGFNNEILPTPVVNAPALSAVLAAGNIGFSNIQLRLQPTGRPRGGFGILNGEGASIETQLVNDGANQIPVIDFTQEGHSTRIKLETPTADNVISFPNKTGILATLSDISAGGGGGGSYTASNGLTMSGSDVQLGGALTENITNIGDFSFSDYSPSLRLSLNNNITDAQMTHVINSQYYYDNNPAYGVRVLSRNGVIGVVGPSPKNRIVGIFENAISASGSDGTNIDWYVGGSIGYDNTSSTFDESSKYDIRLSSGKQESNQNIEILNTGANIGTNIYTENIDGSVYGLSTFKLTGESGVAGFYFDLDNGVNGLTINSPTTLKSGYNTRILPISVNGNFADSTGNITIAGGGGTAISDSLQTYTSGSTVTVNDGVNILLIDPPTLQSAITVTLPATPSTRNDIEIYFGGTITAGNNVVTTITIVGNTGQTLFEALVPTTMSSGEYLSYKFIPSLNRWYAKR